METQIFTNYTDRDFTYSWDSKIYTFKSGGSMMLEKGVANHFAKHLAERELINENVAIWTEAILKERMNRCFAPKADVVVEAPKVETKVPEAKSKRGKTKKEEEFPDLNATTNS